MATVAERCNEEDEVPEAVTEVVYEGDNVCTYIDGIMVSCNGKETPAGRVFRLYDLVLDGDVDMGKHSYSDEEEEQNGTRIVRRPEVLSYRSSDLIPDDELEQKKPLENRTPRFQLFRVKLLFDKYSDRKPFFLSGHITVLNRHVKEASEDDANAWLPPDDVDVSVPAYHGNGWLPLADPDYGVALLFYRHLDEPMRFLNHSLLEPLTPSTHHSIPFYTFLNIIVNLYAISRDPNDDNVFAQLSNEPDNYSLPVEKYDSFYRHKVKCQDGYVDMAYIILTDPVDADIEITFHPDHDISGKLFDVRIIAYYGHDYGLGLRCNPIGFHYSVVLLHAWSIPLLENGRIKLNKSFLAVPTDGTLMIKAEIWDNSDEIDFRNVFEFPAKLKSSSNGCIQGEGCSLKVDVNWKYEAATEDNDGDEIKTMMKKSMLT